MTTPPGIIRYAADAGERPLRQPHAIVAFGGWVDAATAGTGAVRYLVNTLGARKLADLDPEEFYSFTDTRPLTSVVAPGERAMHWPRGEFFAATAPDPSESDILLFVAPEPNLKWRTFASAMLDVVQQAGARSIISLGSIFGAVHHRADVPLTGWATDLALRETLARLQVGFANYEGPTGFVTALLAEAQARGIPSAAILAFTPNYVQGVANPRASHALLKAVADATGLALPLAELERTGRTLLRQIDRLLGDQPDLREQVDRMLRLTGATPPPSSEETDDEPSTQSFDASVELPSPQAVVHELEEFLKQLREKDRGASDSNPGE